jgi:hypothetical protein
MNEKNNTMISNTLKNPRQNIEIKFLADCKEHIPSLAILWFEEISKHWVPNASIDRAKENLLKHINNDKMPLTLVALQDGKAIGMASLRENDGGSVFRGIHMPDNNNEIMPAITSITQ